ncbi:MAG TPA: septum formation initiator family protein [Candidatus Sumerlaeota bacterium]|nr:MAG: Cell division protein FtsB [candidate division BRC1 bacterium ADurb.Bin183]HOE62221.1 septum formation initiator family protein [Candidatus Sumerlaeota bacterium]HRR30638.1 septum formation initiator family protein [Candidatus Sumerlaeia bacterium]HON49136.1 septum formation initiator family protein [Candidatus Sumerlaeota bacterium]HOR64257.1 septum formation initiator family protein [Candidatus Sumerlaeota bacterium]
MMKPLSSFLQGSRWICYLSLLVLGIVIVLWLGINRRNLHVYFENYKRRNQETAKVKALRKRINDLTEEKHLLESACEENEIAVRNKFPMARPGERIVRVERSDFSSMK